MCRPRVGAANLLFSLWRALWCPTAPASWTKSRRTAEESRTKPEHEPYCQIPAISRIQLLPISIWKNHTNFFYEIIMNIYYSPIGMLWMSFIIVIQFIDYSNLIQIFYWLKLIYNKMAKAQVSNITVVQIIELVWHL
jgi:hypothetical protein